MTGGTCSEAKGANGRPSVALAVAILALAAGLVACSEDPQPESDDPVVSQSDAEPEAVSGKPATVLFPGGGISFTAGEPRGKIPAEDTRIDEDMSPGSGNSFLPVQIAQPATRSLTIGAENFALDDYTTTLIVGDEAYPMGKQVEDRFYVKVKTPKQSDKVGIEVSFHGVTQRVFTDGTRDVGEAESLYGYPPSFPSHDCEAGWRLSPGSAKATFTVGFSMCQINAVHYPYYPGVGWSFKKEPGAMWAYVDTAAGLSAASITEGRDKGECTYLGDGSGEVTLDGKSATKVVLDEDVRPSAGPMVHQRHVFLVDQNTAVHKVRIERSWPCTVPSGATTSISIQWEKDVTFGTSSTAG